MQQNHKILGPSKAVPAAVTLAAALTVGAASAALAPAAQAMEAPPVPMSRAAAPFVNWHQGFEHGTDGWYDASTAGPLGWCGGIQQVTPENRGTAGLKPSAGRSYAMTTSGFCNDFWATALPGLFGAPYAPGPELALYSAEWPRAGYVTELDVYLDPSWSEQLYSGNFVFAGSSPDTLVQYAATVFPLDYQPGTPHTGPHYFVKVDALRGQAALDVAGHTVREAGWYTFRLLFSDENGSVRVDFELVGRNGTPLVRQDSVDAINLWGPVQLPYTEPVPTADYGSGHVWFFDIAGGLGLPIDEHRVRRGR